MKKTAHQIYLTEKHNYQSLYPWCLQVNQDSDIATNLIPYSGGFSFRAKSLSYRKELTIESQVQSTEHEFSDYIGAQLDGAFETHPNPNFYMLGSNLVIGNITLNIQAIKDDDNESCTAIGYLNDEDEFCPERSSLHFIANIDSKKYEAIANMIKSRQIDELNIEVNGVEGAYAEWSPMGSPLDVFILTDYSRFSDKQMQVVHKDSDCKINPCRLGKVSSIEMEFSTNLVKNTGSSDPDLIDTNNSPSFFSWLKKRITKDAA